MGDFLIDFRPPEVRAQTAASAASQLAFVPGTHLHVIERDAFTLVLARVDDPAVWGPFEHRSPDGHCTTIGFAGRIALDESEWKAAESIPGPGGLASKAIWSRYRQHGIRALESLNGNFAVIVHDENAGECHLVTDRCGMLLSYGAESGNAPVYSSHPDVLAAVLGESQNWDKTSLAEFLMTSRLTFPYTYYSRIQALQTGSIYTTEVHGVRIARRRTARYFDLQFQTESQATESSLAEDLAAAFTRAVRRRTLPRFGRTAIALSGGLDSRAILSASGGGDHIFGFTLFDDENLELKVAAAVARACRVEFLPIQREFEHYGSSSELGVRLSGGTGSISCNHFLAVRPRLQELGTANLLTGCYCDYLLKGLAFNTHEQRISRVHRLSGFQFEFYDSFHQVQAPFRDRVMERLSALYPEAVGSSLSDRAWLDVERKRSFPLAYEQDLAQRVIPQRVMPWYLPIVDNDIMDVYQRIPARFKLNSALFKKMVQLICPPEVVAIPNSNTSAPADASWQKAFLFQHFASLKNRLGSRLRPRMGTRGSWPNWDYYLRHSTVIHDLWHRENTAARDLFSEILGPRAYSESIEHYRGGDIWLFVRLFTQKLWLDQIVSSGARHHCEPAPALVPVA